MCCGNFRYLLLLIFLSVAGLRAGAQTRLSDPNAVAWFAGFGTFYVSPKTALYAEYQWRREGPLDGWQQSFARMGVQRRLGSYAVGIFGYANAVTYPYGEYPAGPHPVMEHRIWQQYSWDDARRIRIMPPGQGARVWLTLNHRLRAEQRFIQKIPQREAVRRVEGYTYLNRIRYQLRATMPLTYYALRPKNKEFATEYSTKAYLAGYDEIFIGFGKNVNQNIFDQNRIGLLFGYVFDKASRLRVEGGYFNQTVLQGGEVQGKEVVQYNHGMVLNAYYTLYPPPTKTANR